VVLVVSGNRFGGRNYWLVLGAVEASHVGVHGALKVDRQDGLLRLRDGLVEVEGSSLTLLIIGSVGSGDRSFSLAMFCLYPRALDLQLMCVESDLLDFGLDLEIDVELALVAP